MRCTQCGAPLEQGQRFCTNCGSPVQSSPRPEQKPEMDLSQYFDEPATRTPDWDPTPDNRGYAPPVRRQRITVEPEEPVAKPRGSERGLNIALLICAILAVAVVTVLVLILVSGGRNNQDAGNPTQYVPPAVTESQPEIIIPGQQTPGTEGQTVSMAPVLIVTPTPLPAATTPAPTTPAPTIPPTPTPSPSPTPAPDYLLPESNTRYITEADLVGLTHEQLCFARNEIFARHGRIFKTPQIAAYFNSKSWYKGTIAPEDFNTNVFNQYEWANINFIRDYENKKFGGSYY